MEKDTRSDDEQSGPEEEKPEISHVDGNMVDNKKKQWGRKLFKKSLSFWEF